MADKSRLLQELETDLQKTAWYLLAYHLQDIMISVDLISSVVAFYVIGRKTNVHRG
jgi:hypothetical protein